MSRFFWGLLLGLLLLGGEAAAQPVRGLIVKLRPPSDAAGNALPGREVPQAARERLAAVAHDTGVSPQQTARIGAGHHLMRFGGPMQGLALEAAMRRLRLHPDVLAVEPDVLLPLAAVPNDPGFTSQWYLQATTVAPAALNMPLAWDRSTGSAGVTIAVLDTGILKSHPDLAGRYWPGYDFVSEVDFANDGDGRDPDPSDPGDWVSASDIRQPVFAQCNIGNSSWHGTFIAGLVGALTNNASGIAGLNWNAMILPVRVSGKCGAFLSDILDGMRWSAGLTVDGVPANPNRARIVNLSFGGDAPCSASYQDVIDEVTAAGTLVVVAAGNESGALKRPADCRNVLAVGAVQADGLKASYSNFGANLALSAPGGSGSTTATLIYSASNSGNQGPQTDNYGLKQGTSFSAPMAAGVASLMLAVNPSLSPAQLIERIKLGTRGHTNDGVSPSCSSASPRICNCTTSTCGAGLLDGNNALAQAQVPVAIILPVSTPLTGSVVGLDGRLSAASVGSTLVSYVWTQVAGSPLAITTPNAAQASVTLPATPGTFSFKLVVTDNVGRQSTDVISFTSATSLTTSGGGGGGGASGLLWGLGLWLLAALAWRRRKS